MHKTSVQKSVKISRHLARRAFTLIEILVVVGILAIIVAIAIPALSTANRDSLEAAARASSKTLNDARNRAKIKGDPNPVLDGNDAVAAANYLISQNYIRVN